MSNTNPVVSVEDIINWPCGTWCFREELSGMSHMSDDYEVIYTTDAKYQSFLDCNYHGIAKPAVVTLETCSAHGDVLGEGDICGTCDSVGARSERLGDALIAHIDKRIAVMSGTLYVYVKDSELRFKIPVYSFNDAKRIYHTVLNPLYVDKVYLKYTDDDGLEAKHVFQ